MKSKENSAFLKTSGGVIGLIVVLASIIAVNIIVSTVRMRADLTEEKLYTISEGTKNILRDLEQPVVINFYFSNSDSSVPPYMKNYARQVSDLLAEYEIAAKGNLRIVKHNPAPDSEAEESAQREGIHGQRVDMYSPLFYLGLSVVSGDSEGAIPVLDPRREDLLEYNITLLIYRVSHPGKSIVGVMSSLPVLGSKQPPYQMPGQPQPPPQPAWVAFQELTKNFKVREVAPDAQEIEPDIDVMIVHHPKNLSNTTLYAIDQFVLRGGHLIVLVDPVSLVEKQSSGRQDPYGMQSKPSDMKKLLQAWGVGYDSEKVLADLNAITGIAGPNNSVEESPVILTMRNTNVNSDDTAMSRLELLIIPTCGTLTDISSDDIKVTPLITSSKEACLVDRMNAQFGAQAVQSQLKRTGVPYHLALRLEGNFKTAFPNGLAPAQPEKGVTPTATGGLKEGESVIIVIADTDMLFDMFCVQKMKFFGSQPINDNLAFFANITEQMIGSTDLIGIRSRGKFNRPFDKVMKMAQDADKKLKDKERTLMKSLQETQQKLMELPRQQSENQTHIISDEQKSAIANFRKDEVRIRKELREVRKSLRRDIKKLGLLVKSSNIALMPMLVCLVGLAFYLRRRSRER
ncbi:MAG: GldG family protein [Kiritimatiellae bacterium]|nr:GldG family protein [Kiritimatiellia bacterium]